MSASASCPVCHRPTVAPDSAGQLVTCPRCGTAFVPTDATCTGADLPLADPLPESAPSAATLKRSRPWTLRAGANRWWLIAAGGAAAVLVVAAVVWLKARARPVAVRPAELRAVFPDESFELAFPPGAQWEDEPVGVAGGGDRVGGHIRLFRGRANGYEFAVRVGRLNYGRTYSSPADDARTELRDFSALVREGAVQSEAQTTCNGYPAAQKVVRAADDYVMVIRSVVVGETSYLMYVRGERMEPDDPLVKQFFDSFRHRDLAPPVAYTPPEGEPLRPLAKLPYMRWATFAPKGDSLYAVTSLEPEWSANPPPPVLARYDVPSFRRTATYDLPKDGTLQYVDAATGRAFLIGYKLNNFSRVTNVDVRRYDLAAPTGAGTPGRAVPAGECNLTGDAPLWGYETALSGDGKYLFVLYGPFESSLRRGQRGEPADAVLYRINTETMVADRQIKVPLATGGLAAAPNGSCVYAVANRQPTTAGVLEIDCATFTVRRELTPPPGPVDHIWCTSAGTLIMGGTEYRGGKMTYTSITQPLRALDVSGGVPVDRRLAAISSYPLTVTNGHRMLVRTTQHQFPNPDVEQCEIWNLESELRAWRPASVTVRLNGVTALAPDSKLFVLGTTVYWLGGAGPLPAVDPAAKWKP